MSINDKDLLSEVFGGEWEDSPPPVRHQLLNAAEQFPDKLALACLHQPADLYDFQSLTDSHLQWSYAQLSAAADILSAGLQAHRISSGSSIATVLGNGAEFGLSFWAAHKIGCPFVPLNPQILSNATEARHMLVVANVTAVILGNVESAAKFDALYYPSQRTILKVVVGEPTISGWISFSDLLAAGRKYASFDGEISYSPLAPTYEPDSTVSTLRLPTADEIVTVLFTSGTTSLPKGCPHTNRTLNAFMKNLALGGSSPNDIFCGVLPNNHAMGYFFALYFFCQGGAVVYPSASFDSARMAEALIIHSCTHTCLVPTALHSLLDRAEGSGLTFPMLHDVLLAGSSITPHNLRQIVHNLGSRAVSTGFGMTEGSPVWTAATSDPETLIVGDDTISGRASPGVHLRICTPGSTHALPRGQPGEVHESGPGVITGYLGNNVGSDSFYVDKEARKWFKTGDQAVMHRDGRVSIVGRYKDMIIRGGENIAPAAIESVLNRFPGVEAQVVAAADAIAGEVPVAIVRKFPAGETSPRLLQDVVRTSMGLLYVPDEVIPLHLLGLDDYPRTTSGKVQKSTLRSLVSAHRQRRSLGVREDKISLNPNIDLKFIEETVLHVWWRATGIEPSNLDREAPIFNFADSITILRVRDMYRKEIGVTLSADEVAEHSNLQRQITALFRKVVARKEPVHPPLTIAGPPSLDEIQVLLGPESSAVTFKESTNAVIAKHGFDFDRDVESVIPTSDFINVLIRTKIIDTWNFGIAIVAEGSTMPALRQGLITALKNNPLWPSFYVLGSDNTPFYVTLKSRQKLYDQCLTDCGSVATLADLQQLAIQYPHPEHSIYPGPLFHALLFHIEELKSAAFIMYIHHMVHDASSMRLVLEDLNQALRAPSRPLRPHLPFQMWADIYHSLRNSPRATLEVDWHVRRLSDIHLHRKALYPPARVPRKAITETPDGIDYGFDAPSLLHMKQHHPHITASVVLKAAMALINVTRTQHTHALFSNFEAARSGFPFWPETLRHLPSADGTTMADLDASDVAGPTMNAVTNLIAIQHDEPALSFLNRIQNEQMELTKRAHAPWRRIIDKLNAMNPGENAGEMLHQTHGTQFLTWVPGFLGDYEKIRVVQIGIRAALGLVFVAGLGGPQATTYMISLRWDVANYSQEEVERFVKDVEKAIMWLLEEDSWAQPISDFLGRF